ncbi:MAG: STAS-like domain-containing protein [Deltaproteobacteria bacterium]|jgi:anti-sigma regulatory factor (Ser/Thr protein kinase)|nr:STAS-like domain-containing protein [Deltaproteobacteria bacterium]
MKFTKEVVDLIKNYIISNISRNPNQITQQTCDHLGITKPTVLKYINELGRDRIIEKTGSNRYPKYRLVKTKYVWKYSNQDLEEDVLWRNDIAPLLKDSNNNVKDICQYGFTEMVNNVIDHSQANKLITMLTLDCLDIEIWINDDGIGIFRKIKNALGLEQSSHAILELAKGKFTSDPENHSGEGIFFTSRIFDEFAILSHKLCYTDFGHTEGLIEKGILWEKQEDIPGTSVHMKIEKKSNTQLKDVFDEYADPEKDPSFHKTIIPVKLMEYEGESLISRSQAKRLITRFDKFVEVILNFDGVTQIGQAFADQIFRVFPNKHPEVHLRMINLTKDVENMIKRVQSNK